MKELSLGRVCLHLLVLRSVENAWDTDQGDNGQDFVDAVVGLRGGDHHLGEHGVERKLTHELSNGSKIAIIVKST